MIKTIFKILVIFLLAILELALISKFSIFGAIPNLILLVAIVLVLRGNFEDAVLVTLVGGIFLDLASPLRFGIFTLSMLAIIFFINFFLLKTIPTPNNSIAFLIFVASLIFADLVIFLGLRVWPNWEILPQALINGLWGVLTYSISKCLIQTELIKI